MTTLCNLFLRLFCTLGATAALSMGRFPVQLTSSKLVDHGRLDPFAPKPSARALMISTFTPVDECHQTSPTAYMPLATSVYEDDKFAKYGVPNGTFVHLDLVTCQDVPRRKIQRLPLVLFSGALGTSRFLYNALAASVASAGYIVTTVDHPYDTDIVEFPSGKIIYGLNLTNAQIPLAIRTRALDLLFVRKEMLARCCTSRKYNTGLFGHSLGGAGVIAALEDNMCLAGGINLDGSVFGPTVQYGTSRPVLLFGHEGKDLVTDPTWGALWPNLHFWKQALELAGGVHYTFSDLPLLAEKLFNAGEIPQVPTALVGQLPGTEALQIVTRYVVAFMDMFVKWENVPLLKQPNSEYPEVGASCLCAS